MVYLTGLNKPFSCWPAVNMLPLFRSVESWLPQRGIRLVTSKM